MARANGAAAAENAANTDALKEEQVKLPETQEEQTPPDDQEPSVEQPEQDEEALVSMIVAQRRTVHDGADKHLPGARIKLSPAEAKRLKDKGFVIDPPPPEKAES